MPAGFQAINDGNIVQVDENFRCQRLKAVQSVPANRYGNWVRLQGVDIRNECPLIFARCSGWFGGMDIRNIDGTSGSVAVPTGVIFVFNSTPMDLAIFSSKDGLVASASGVGCESFDAAGNLIYASYLQYPRIHTIVDTSGSVTSSAVGFAQQSSQPWVCLNPLVPSLSRPLGSGSDLSYPPFMHVVQCTLNTLNFRYVDNGDALGPLAANTSVSPYNGRRIQVPVANIPGY